MAKPKYPKFGKALVVARLQMGVNAGREIRMAVLAKKLKVTPGFLSSLEHGRKHPSVEMLARIVRVYPGGTIPALRRALGIERGPVKPASKESK